MKSFIGCFLLLILICACSATEGIVVPTPVYSNAAPIRTVILTSTQAKTSIASPDVVEITPTHEIFPSSTHIPTSTQVPFESVLMHPTPVNSSLPGKIAYSKVKIPVSEFEYDQAIYVSNLDGTNAVSITEGLEGKPGEFSWSPDGSWILFFQKTGPIIDDPDDNDDIPFWPLEVWLYSIERAEKLQVADITAHYGMHYPLYKWSTDSKFVLLICPVDKLDHEICLLDVDSSKLTRTGIQGIRPAFSPNGTRFGWMSMDHNSIYISNVISCNPSLIYSVAGGEVVGFSWGNDGNSIIAAESVIIGEPSEHYGFNWICVGRADVGRIDLDTFKITHLMSIDVPISGWKLSSNQKLLLTNITDCHGNAYSKDGIVNLADKSIIWPLGDGRAHTLYNWTDDYKYLMGLEAPGYRFYIDPNTGEFLEFIQPDWIHELTTEDEAYHGVFILWKVQP